jgi:hypothetical protein
MREGGNAHIRLAYYPVVCLDGVSRRTAGLRACVRDVNFTGVRPAASAAESVVGRAVAVAWISTRGNNSPLQNPIRAGFRK